MPQAKAYDFNNPNDISQREIAKQEFARRRMLVERNSRYYDGDHHKPLKIKGGIDDNVIFNWPKQSVDAMAAFLMPHMPTIELDEHDDTEDEQFVRAAWETNGDAALLYHFVMYGAKAGHVFGILTEDKPHSRILPIDPANIIVWTHEDDQNRIEWFEQQWGTVEHSDERIWRKDTVPIRDADDNATAWEEFTYQRDGDKWKLFNEYTWNYPLSPIVAAPHFPVPGKYYGQPEITDDLIVLNNAGNKVASEINRILRFYAFPIRALFGGRLPDDKTTVANFYDGFDKDARIENIEMQSDLAASRAHLADIKNTYFRQARVVIPPGDVEAFRGVTALGIQATYMPMITKNEILRRQYSQLIRGITRRLLMVAGRDYEVEPMIEWGNALPIDDMQELEIIERMVALGMSRKTAFQRLGLNWDKEQEQKIDEELMDGVMINGLPVGVSG